MIASKLLCQQSEDPQIALARKLRNHAVTSLSEIICSRRSLEYQMLKFETKKAPDRHGTVPSRLAPQGKSQGCQCREVIRAPCDMRLVALICGIRLVALI